MGTTQLAGSGAHARRVRATRAARPGCSGVTGPSSTAWLRQGLLEGAPHGIRVNTVNPDAVIKGSRIWDGNWRRERADAYGIDSGAALEAHYRDRSMLKREVLPADIANAVYFFASELSAKSTGNMLNVDAGNAVSFAR